MSGYNIKFGRGMNMQLMLAMLEEDDEIPLQAARDVQIALLPPVNALDDITDEDSGPEDGAVVDNLPGSQLRASAELCLGGVEPEDEVEEIEEQTTKKKKKGKEKRKYVWKKSKDIKNLRTEWPTKAGPNNNLSPLQLFALFFDEEVIDMIVTNTNKYAAKKNKLGDVSCDEMKVFLGILLLSGYVPLPRRRMFWQNRKDSYNAMVAEAMPRDRFEFIMSNLHFCDNDALDASDKFSKIRVLFNLLNERFQEYAPHEENHSVDETMVPYFGRHGCKQFIRGKPIRWGYKLWTGATPKGYVVWSEPYQGKSANDYEFGLGGHVILKYADIIKKIGQFSYHLYFDNFFTSVQLLEELRRRGIFGTGTIRENRLANCPLPKKAELKKTERGTIVYASDKDKNIVLCSWNDNSIVTIASNAIPVHPTKSVSRYSSKAKKKIQVAQPCAIAAYNQYMGGVDRFDENVGNLRISIRGKKWYCSLAQYLIDAAEHNAWQLHRLQGGKMDHLEFRRAIVQDMLPPIRAPGAKRRHSTRAEETSDLRYDGYEHYIVPQGKQTRCAVCHKNSTTKCQKCERALHLKGCFIAYHEK